MWVEKLKDPKNKNKVIGYKYYQEYEDPKTGKTRRVSANHPKNTKAVNEEMTAILKEKVRKKLNQTSPGITFSFLADKWFEVYKKTVKLSTATNTKGRVNSIKNHLGQYPLQKLTPAIVNTYLLECLTERDNAYRTVSLNKSLILRILKFGSQYDYIDNMPYESKVTIPLINTTKKDPLKFLERAELKQMYEQLENMEEYEILRLCRIQVNTGMRFNEMVALNYTDDIDLEKRIIYITKNYDAINKVFTSPKTGDSRSIDINVETATIIKEQIEFDKLKMIKYNLSRKDPLLFRNKKDNPISLREINRKLKGIDIKDKSLTTHIFRHTFITLMVEAGVPKELIARHVGHSSTKMIDRIYTHFTAKMEKQLRVEIEKFSAL